MFLHPRILLLGSLAFGICLGCRPQQSIVPPVEPPAAPDSRRQEMAALSFIAYLGDDLEGSDPNVEKKLYPCLENQLKYQPLTRDWTVAWGPAVYKFTSAELDDNMMYVVRKRTKPEHLAIVVRGTNPKAILDWLVEDFNVDDQVPWGSGSPPSGARISKGTSDGLNILVSMAPASGPSPNQTLSTFLANQLQTYPTLQIDITGHSLGGALSPALALWLVDNRQKWDPQGKAQIAVYPLAGPTAGNSEFSTYSDSRIGAFTDRIHQPFDIVPLAWNHENMGTIADLYEPHARADSIERGLVDGLRSLTRDKGYSQIKPGAPARPGALNPEKKGFAEQAGWQHHCGYQCSLGLAPSKFLPVTTDCSQNSVPPNPCPVCPPPAP